MWPIVEVEVWRKRVNMEDRWGQMEQDMPKYRDDRNIWGEKVLSEGLGRSLSFKDRKIDIAAHDRSGKKV